jgi:DNA-binding CsgD family transcriptional regulator
MPDQPPEVKAVARLAGAAALNQRDLELLRHLAAAMSTAAVAAAMSISTNTVRTRIRRLARKLSVVGRAQVAERAYQLGII